MKMDIKNPEVTQTKENLISRPISTTIDIAIVTKLAVATLHIMTNRHTIYVLSQYNKAQQMY